MERCVKNMEQCLIYSIDQCEQYGTIDGGSHTLDWLSCGLYLFLLRWENMTRNNNMQVMDRGSGL